MIGLIPNRERIDRVIAVAAGSGYWRENAWPTKRFVLWLWYVAAPLAISPVRLLSRQTLAQGGRPARWRDGAVAPLVPQPRLRRQRR